MSEPKVKLSFKEKMEKIDEKNKARDAKFKAMGDKVSKAGVTLTLILTVPLILTIFLGPLGFAIGSVVAIVAIAGMFKK